MRNGYRAPSPAGKALFRGQRCSRIVAFPNGESCVRRYSFSTYACIRFDGARKAVFSFRCLPHWGRGTAPAVDRVLSYIVDLRRSPSLSFIPPSPSNLRPFGAPPSIGRRECPREPLPLEGAAERSEAGLASFFAAKPPPLCLSHRGKGDRVAALGCFRKRRT